MIARKEMMQIMPIPIGLGKSKFFDQRFFRFEIFNHFFNGDVIVSNSGRLSITFYAEMFQLNYECGLMRLCSFRNGERMTEFEIVIIVRDSHGGEWLIS